MALAPAAGAAPDAPLAVVTAAEGPPIQLIRGTRLFEATRGVAFQPGDLIETGPRSLLVLEIDGGAAARVALGPSSRAYWMDRSAGITLALLIGWIKVDTLASGGRLAVESQGRWLDAASGAGVYVLDVAESVDQVFQEEGSMSLRPRTVRAKDTGIPSRPNQLTSLGDDGTLRTHVGADRAFLAALPPAFRDPLPKGIPARLQGGPEPLPIREVTYEDVAPWLTAPREWRAGLIKRFRPRLKDPAFFAALDAHMSAHPEWRPILHPATPPTATLPDAAPPQ